MNYILILFRLYIMNDISGIIRAFIRNPRDALVFGLTTKGANAHYIKNITKMRKFMSKFVSKGNYVQHILKMNNSRGNKLAKQDVINTAITHYKQLTFCQYCWLDTVECYCNEDWFDYMRPSECFENDAFFTYVDQYFARIQ